MSSLTRTKTGWILLISLAVVTLALMTVLDKIPQDPAYHNFADTRLFAGIPNVLNVLSNLPFLIVGVIGFYRLRSTPKNQLHIVQSNRAAYLIFFLGIALVCFGSAYFHWSPNNTTLLWDRLPMTIAFMALVSIIVSEYISAKFGNALLLPLLVIGAASVFYWWFTEAQGNGDLRFYAIVQFFPMLAIPIILFCFKSDYSHTNQYWLLIGTYVLAKLFEHFDVQVFDALSIVSGHSIKHVVPVIGIAILLKSYTTPPNLATKPNAI